MPSTKNSSKISKLNPPTSQITHTSVAELLFVLDMTHYCHPYEGGDIGQWLDQLVFNSDPLRQLQKDPTLFIISSKLCTGKLIKDLKRHSPMNRHHWNDVVTIIFEHSKHPEVIDYKESNLWDVTVDSLYRIANVPLLNLNRRLYLKADAFSQKEEKRQPE